ncbi:uncharacterized protein LOC142540587 isoform X4 [Primulina tabacum]|uniref:uncharacterized protein LOC142540587 isoform X4 n=1 Tax=Primulina tabacum TaxID=48773 RepID=UPI003F5A6E06
MEDWDAQKMLDKYVHDYMIRNNMHDAANIFAEEANICLRPVAINSEEGFLAEWWSLFWDVYSDILSKHPSTTEGYASKDSIPVNYQATQNAGNCSQKILLEMERPDMNDMSQNISAAMGMLGLPNQPQTVHLTALPSPDMENLHQSTPPMTMPRPDMKGDFLTNLVAASIHEQEHLMFPERGLDFNSQLLNVDQLARMLPSSSKCSYPLEMVPQKPFGNCGFVTNFTGYVAAQPIHHGESNLIQPKAEPSDSEFVGQCVTKGHCCCLELDSSTSSNSASSDPSPEFKNLF